MTNLLSEEEIFARLSVILQEALRIGPTEIVLQAGLFDELGAESLDLLDIRFRADKEFDIRTTDEDLIQSLGKGLSADEVKKKLTVRSLVLYIKQCLLQKSETL